MKKLLVCLASCVMVFICAFSLVACDLGGGGTTSTGGSNNDPDKCQHSYGQYMSNGNASCTQDGTKTAYCDKCGYTNTVPDIGSKLAHTFVYYSYDNNASCTQEGTKTAYCTVCHTAKDTVADEYHPMRDHTFTDYKSDNNATCDTNGTKTAVCDACKIATDTVEEANTAGHNYVNGACSVCNASHLTYELAGKEYSVTGIAEDCTATEIVVPSTENGLPVFRISDTAFKDNATITKITLPDSVRLIGNSSFNGCTNLENVIFGEGLTSVRYMAFTNCTSLESITFPDSLRELGNEALADCTKLKTVSFGKNLASLLSNCFDGCLALERVDIPDENPSFSIVGNVIYQGSGLALYNLVYVPHAISGKVAIADGFTKIPATSFQNRNKITGIYIPKSVRTINDYAFNGCTLLSDLYYEGSEEDWNSITKGRNWSTGAPEFTVHFNASSAE